MSKKPVKAAAPFVPVPQGVQRRKHQRQLARMAHWKPLTFSQQRQAHRAAAAATAAHHKHAVKAKKVKKARGWSPDEAVALCSARAVAESLRLALGVTVPDADVLALHAAAGGHPDKGAPIVDVLRAAQARVGLLFAGQLAFNEGVGTYLDPQLAHALILGLDLPGAEPHAVAVAPDGTWWSWGEPYSPADFPGAVIEEAWAVQWQQ